MEGFTYRQGAPIELQFDLCRWQGRVEDESKAETIVSHERCEIAERLSHGAAFLVYRTGGALRDRARHLERRLWMVAGALFVVVTIETAFVRPELFPSLVARPLAWAFTALAIGGVITGARAHARNQDALGFVSSSAVLAGLLGATAAALFPTLLHSTLDPSRSVTAEQALGAPYGVSVAIIWWPIAFALALTYLAFAFRANQEKVRSEPERDA